jgi:import receptor subunit TOM70
MRAADADDDVFQERAKYAAAFKTKGNAAYTKRNFTEAAEFYTKAIQVTPKPEPVFYSNRAACASQMLFRRGPF